MWHFSGKICYRCFQCFMNLKFFYSLFFLCRLFQSSLKIDINLLGTLVFCNQTKSHMTTNQKKGSTRPVRPSAKSAFEMYSGYLSFMISIH